MKSLILCLFLILSSVAYAEDMAVYDVNCEKLSGSLEVKLTTDCEKQAADTSAVFSFVDDAKDGFWKSINFSSLLSNLSDENKNPRLVFLYSAFDYASNFLLVLLLVYTIASSSRELVKASARGDFLGSTRQNLGKSFVTKVMPRIVLYVMSPKLFFAAIAIALSLAYAVVQIFLNLMSWLEADNDSTLQYQLKQETQKLVDNAMPAIKKSAVCTYRQDKMNLWSQIDYVEGSGQPYQFFPEQNDYYKCVRDGQRIWSSDNLMYVSQYLRDVKYCSDKELAFETVDCGSVAFTQNTSSIVKAAFVDAESDLNNLAVMYTQKACAENQKDSFTSEVEYARACMKYDANTHELAIEGGKFVIDDKTQHSAEALEAADKAIRQKLYDALYSAAMTHVMNYKQAELKPGLERVTNAILNQSHQRQILKEQALASVEFSANFYDERQGHLLEKQFSAHNEMSDGQKSRTANYMRIDDVVDDYAGFAEPFSIKKFLFEAADAATEGFYSKSGFGVEGCEENQCSMRDSNPISVLYNSSKATFSLAAKGVIAMKSISAMTSIFGTKNPNGIDHEATMFEQVTNFLGNLFFGVMIMSITIHFAIVMMFVSAFAISLFTWLQASLNIMLFYAVTWMKFDSHDNRGTDVFKPLLILMYVFFGPSLIVVSLFLAMIVCVIVASVSAALFLSYVTYAGLLNDVQGFDLGSIVHLILVMIAFYSINAYTVMTVYKSSIEVIKRSTVQAMQGSQDFKGARFIEQAEGKAKHSVETAAESLKTNAKRF